MNEPNFIFIPKQKTYFIITHHQQHRVIRLQMHSNVKHLNIYKKIHILHSSLYSASPLIHERRAVPSQQQLYHKSTRKYRREDGLEGGTVLLTNQ